WLCANITILERSVAGLPNDRGSMRGVDAGVQRRFGRHRAANFVARSAAGTQPDGRRRAGGPPRVRAIVSPCELEGLARRSQEEMRDWRRPRLGIPHFTLALVLLPLGAPGAQASPPRPSVAAVRSAASESTPSTRRLGCWHLSARPRRGAPLSRS